MKNAFLCAAVVVLSCGFALGQQYKVLWNFTGFSDGGLPYGTLVSDSAGNLYGTTLEGGEYSEGTVFELYPNGDGTWSQTVLHSLCDDEVFCFEGLDPQAGLVRDQTGNLFGTTSAGGGAGECNGEACGVVFELSPPTQGGSWTYQVIHWFCVFRCSDGATPRAPLLLDPTGNLYGTTTSGGDGQQGTVFELSPGGNGGAWTFSLLYGFCIGGGACSDGARPEAGVTLDNAGNLYGTTEDGGSGGGTVFELSPALGGWTERVLASHKGAYPAASVRFDQEGNLYGTYSGGAEGLPGRYGGVFKLSPKNGYSSRVFRFDLTDGAVPWAEVLIDSKRRVLYGTTSGAGLENINYHGNIFQIDATGHQSVLYTFCQQANCPDGALPFSGLFKDSSGNLFGMTSQGGTYDRGVVFEITP